MSTGEKSDYQNHGLVFATAGGTPLHPRNIVGRHFEPWLKRAGLPSSIRLYELRHSCAILLLAAGEHPKVVSEGLGHSSSRMTPDVYSRVLPTMQQAASDRLERILSGAASTLAAHKSGAGNE
jgi:integrase